MPPFLTDPDPAEILRVPGYLFWEPTNLAAEATWGTKLGFCEKGIEIELEPQVGILTGEEGNMPKYKVYFGIFARLWAVLRNYNATALARLFPGLTSGTLIKYPSTILPGADLTGASYTGHLLFAPDDRTSNPIVLFQKASPNLKGSVKLSRVTDTAWPVVFDGFAKTADADGTFFMGAIGSGVIR